MILIKHIPLNKYTYLEANEYLSKDLDMRSNREFAPRLTERGRYYKAKPDDVKDKDEHRSLTGRIIFIDYAHEDDLSEVDVRKDYIKINYSFSGDSNNKTIIIMPVGFDTIALHSYSWKHGVIKPLAMSRDFDFNRSVKRGYTIKKKILNKIGYLYVYTEILSRRKSLLEMMDILETVDYNDHIEYLLRYPSGRPGYTLDKYYDDLSAYQYSR